VLPDTCKCKKWWNSVKDARGRPVFRKSNGDPQDTGYTGLDCNVPICVQAKQFLLNDGGNYVLFASATNASTFQAGCANATRYTPGSRTRVSSHLCNVENWWEGVYVDSWANGLTAPPYSETSRGRYIRSNFDNYIQINSEKWIAGPLVEGEGIFACYNNGSCVAPDTCECPDGWTGVDCSVPLCRHVNVFNETVSCLHRGICGSRDKCTCVQRPSLLHLMHPDEPKVLTVGLIRRAKMFLEGVSPCPLAVKVAFGVPTAATAPLLISARAHRSGQATIAVRPCVHSSPHLRSSRTLRLLMPSRFPNLSWIHVAPNSDPSGVG
jgi:hypothetical protein